MDHSERERESVCVCVCVWNEFEALPVEMVSEPSLQNYQDYDLENLKSLSTIEDSLAIFCLATYGEGEPTDNAREFYDWLKEAVQEKSIDLTGVRYTVRCCMFMGIYIYIYYANLYMCVLQVWKYVVEGLFMKKSNSIHTV